MKLNSLSMSKVLTLAMALLSLFITRPVVEGWNGLGAPFYYKPFDSPNYLMEFSWSMRTSGTSQYLVGTFRSTVPDGQYVSVGTLSDTDMDGLMILCVVHHSSPTPCDDYHGEGYDIDPYQDVSRISRTRVISSSYNGTTKIHSVTFERFVVENGVDLGEAALGQKKRTIWAYGPMDGDEPEEHPGAGIAGASIDFASGEVVWRPENSRRAVHFVELGVTVVIAFILRIIEVARIQVHHYVRFAFGIIFPLIYFVLFCVFVARAYNDYVTASSLGPFVRALGDGALFVFNGLLLTVSRRFFFSEFFFVSHERAIKYHIVLGLLLLIIVGWHVLGMTGMYFASFVLSWSTMSHFPPLAGAFALICFLGCVIFALLRFEVSYKLFRLTHYLWIPSIVFTCLHVPDRAWIILFPGMFLIFINFVYGRLVNCSANVTKASFDEESRTLIAEVTRSFIGCLSPTSCHSSTRNTIGVMPAQWFYIAFPDISYWQYHPFSIARADVTTDPSTGKTTQRLKFAIKETRGTGGGGGIIRNALTKLYDKFGVTETVRKFKERQSWTGALADHMAAQNSRPQRLLRLDDDLGDILMRSPHEDEDNQGDITSPLPISIEGPFGSVQLPLASYRNIILVSGGIGVTPNLLILQHLATMALAGERDWDNIVFLWVNRDDALIKLFAKDLEEFTSMARDAGVNVSLRLFVTRAGEPSKKLAAVATDRKLGIVRGRRPDFDEELKHLSDSAKDKDQTAALYSCGPVPMLSSATDAANRSAGLNGMKVHVHTEVFDV